MLKVVFAVLQTLLTLVPELMNSAADAKATNAINKVYSMRSWPPSSFQNARTKPVNVAIMIRRYQSLLREALLTMVHGGYLTLVKLGLGPSRLPAAGASHADRLQSET